MSLVTLKYGCNAFEYVETLQKFRPDLSLTRAQLLSQAMAALDDLEIDCLKLASWYAAATTMLATCQEKDRFAVIEIVQNHLLQLHLEAIAAQSSDQRGKV